MKGLIKAVRQQGCIATLCSFGVLGLIAALAMAYFWSVWVEKQNEQALLDESRQIMNHAKGESERLHQQIEQSIHAVLNASGVGRSDVANALIATNPFIDAFEIVTIDELQGNVTIKSEALFTDHDELLLPLMNTTTSTLKRRGNTMNSSDIWFSGLRFPHYRDSHLQRFLPSLEVVAPIRRPAANRGSNVNQAAAAKRLVTRVNLQSWMQALKQERFDLYLVDYSGYLFPSHRERGATQFNRTEPSNGYVLGVDTFVERFGMTLTQALQTSPSFTLVWDASYLFEHSHQAYVVVAPKASYLRQLAESRWFYACVMFAFLSIVLIPLVLLAAVNVRKLQRQSHENMENIQQYSDIIDRQVPIMETNLAGKIVRCNQALSEISGYQAKELIGKNSTFFRHPQARPMAYRDMWKRISSGQVWTGEFHNRSKMGDDFWLKADVIPIYRSGHQLKGFMSIASDISDKKRLERYSDTDNLTCIANRNKLEKVLDDEFRRAKRYQNAFSILLIDIDYFKSINDRFGHLAGDAVLKELASLVKHNIRSTDCAGRWGGEEFVIVCRETRLNSAVRLANKLSKLVARYDFAHVGKMTVSIGVAEYERTGSLKDLIHVADTHLYRAKKLGRNQVSSPDEVNNTERFVPKIVRNIH